MAVPWKAIWTGTKIASPALGVGAFGLYGAMTTNSDVNTEQVRGAAITAGLGMGAVGLGYGAYKGIRAMWSGGKPIFEESTYPSARPGKKSIDHLKMGRQNVEIGDYGGYRDSNRVGKVKSGSRFDHKIPTGQQLEGRAAAAFAKGNYKEALAVGEQLRKYRSPIRQTVGKYAGKLAGSIALGGIAGIGIMAAASMISYRDDAASLAANIAGSAASSSGFDPGEGGSYYQSANQQFVRSTEGLVQGLHRSRH